MFFVFPYISDQNKTQEICNRVIFEDSFSITYIPNQYKTQQKFDGTVDGCLAALKVVPDWFVLSKMLEKLDNALHANYDMLFYNEDFNKLTFIACQRQISCWRS